MKKNKDGLRIIMNDSSTAIDITNKKNKIIEKEIREKVEYKIEFVIVNKLYKNLNICFSNSKFKSRS